jgi:hypothetical protein
MHTPDHDKLGTGIQLLTDYSGGCSTERSVAFRVYRQLTAGTYMPEKAAAGR